jgi:quinoprotein glucose dehydrogenase
VKLTLLRCAVMLCAALAVSAQDDVRKGVYTAEQARRGEAAYAQNCASCHGAAMESFSGPTLKGQSFLDHWREFPLEVLHKTVAETMPWGKAGSLDKAAYLDIIARILEVNELPAGKTELTAATLATTLVGKDGPQPLPSSSPVLAIGCMTLDVGNGWFVAGSKEPGRTLDQWAFSPAETATAVQSGFGAQVYRLLNLADLPDFNINAAVGTKIAVKGILVRQQGNPRINVTAAKTVAPKCEEPQEPNAR